MLHVLVPHCYVVPGAHPVGHVHVIQLPRTPAWRVVIDLLGTSAGDAPTVASATATAAADRLDALRDDPSLTYCFWLLTRLASAARGPDFVDDLAVLGLSARPAASVVGFVSQVTDRVRDEIGRHPESGPFGELASLALRRALLETVGTEGRSLFGSSLEDLERAFRQHATPVQFGHLARGFFGDFLARTLRFYVEKELSNRVGASPALVTTADSRAFADELDRYGREAAGIMEGFAVDWFDLHHWRADGWIGREEAQGFVAHALDKLRGELARSQA
ncbi:MAG: hypothetical protein M3R02_17750 [Chloroflexota bacterium]|nr:hypothetical protein [Chloroflexota bacterium]